MGVLLGYCSKGDLSMNRLIYEGPIATMPYDSMTNAVMPTDCTDTYPKGTVVSKDQKLARS